jgi:hypothetical protein
MPSGGRRPGAGRKPGQLNKRAIEAVRHLGPVGERALGVLASAMEDRSVPWRFFFPTNIYHISNIDENKKAMTIQSQLDMTSGIDWRERAYTPDETIMRFTRVRTAPSSS